MSNIAKGPANRGGVYYPDFFNPQEGLELVGKLLDIRPADSELDRQIDKKLGYKRSLFTIEDTALEEYTSDFIQAVEFFDERCRNIGKIVQKPCLTVIEYQPESFMLPHYDKGISNPLFSLSGRGVFETFEFNDDTACQVSNGNYPKTALTSQDINPGDMLLSFANTFHGFRNGSEPRIVVGLLDGNIAINQ